MPVDRRDEARETAAQNAKIRNFAVVGAAIGLSMFTGDTVVHRRLCGFFCVGFFILLWRS